MNVGEIEYDLDSTGSDRFWWQMLVHTVISLLCP